MTKNKKIANKKNKIRNVYNIKFGYLKLYRNVVLLINTDFDYAQSDGHPERSRKVLKICIFSF